MPKSKHCEGCPHDDDLVDNPTCEYHCHNGSLKPNTTKASISFSPTCVIVRQPTKGSEDLLLPFNPAPYPGKK